MFCNTNVVVPIVFVSTVQHFNFEDLESLVHSDGRYKGDRHEIDREMLKAIMKLIGKLWVEKRTDKGGGRKDRRQGKGRAVKYGGRGRGKGGHEKGDQGKG